MSKGNPKPKRGPVDVLARYGAFYQGDDDEFAHCFVLADRRCILLFQGLETVLISIVEAPAKEFDQLKALLAQGIPPAWPGSSYAGYNFVTDAEGPNASEIAVYGVQAAGALAEYYSAPADSDIGKLVKAIANVD